MSRRKTQSKKSKKKKRTHNHLQSKKKKLGKCGLWAKKKIAGGMTEKTTGGRKNRHEARVNLNIHERGLKSR